MPLSLEEFVRRWIATKRSERGASHEHFLDLCHLLNVPTPAQADEPGEAYTFDKHVTKADGGQGFADVWKRGYFAWEYKAPGTPLADAYFQLLNYATDLDNPPLLVLSDLRSFQIRTNFNNTKQRVFAFTVRELGYNKPTENCPLPPLDVLRALFNDPELLRPERTAERVTSDAAREFLKLNLERASAFAEET